MTRHETYYLDDGSVVFQASLLFLIWHPLCSNDSLQVEQVLFKVHRYFFVTHSVIFASMFTMPPGEGNSVEGLSDEMPILLPGVSVRDFERFLGVFYPADFSELETSIEHWCSVLEVATKWEFDSVRALAIRKLDEEPQSAIPPADRISMALKYRVEEWLLSPYVELVSRPTPVSLEEGRKLGIEDVVLLMKAREDIKTREIQMQQVHAAYYGVNATPLNERQSVWDAVAAIFRLPTARPHRLGRQE